MVLYRALYGECGQFVRPYNMFLEEVPKEKENPTGQKYRFQEFEVKSLNKNNNVMGLLIALKVICKVNKSLKLK